MRRRCYLATLIVFIAFSLVSQAETADEFELKQWVRLKAFKAAGVPIHREAQSSMKGRVRDGTVAQIKDLADDGHWLLLDFGEGHEGWVVEKYVDGQVAPPVEDPVDGEDPDLSDQASLVWDSLEGCESVLELGRRMGSATDILRLASWNVRWFAEDTDVPWLACTIAWMNLDVVAIQEFKADQEAQAAKEQLLSRLQGYTGDRWSADLHECGPSTSQHVGFLWNTERVELSDPRDVWQMNARANPDSSPCRKGLRPGRYAYLRSRSDNGVDFHIVSVHLKSSPTSAARGERITAVNRLDQMVAPWLSQDADVIVLGDFNTMGDGSSGSAQGEIDALLTLAAMESPGFVRYDAIPRCSEYFRGHGGWLDHVLVSREMSEAVFATASVTGYCGVHACQDLENMPAAYQDLSDHCPLVFEVRDQDEDLPVDTQQ